VRRRKDDDGERDQVGGMKLKLMPDEASRLRLNPHHHDWKDARLSEEDEKNVRKHVDSVEFGSFLAFCLSLDRITTSSA
jgi:hypothetical protein